MSDKAPGRWAMIWTAVVGGVILLIIGLYVSKAFEVYELVPKDKEGFGKWVATIKALPVLAYVLAASFLILAVLLYWVRSRRLKPVAQPADAVVAQVAAIPLTPHDEKLFQSFRGLFAENGYVSLYRDHHFLSPFPRAAWVPLMRVADTWTDASHMFSHPELEARALVFRQAAVALATAIATYTTPTDSQTHITVVPRHVDPEDPPQWIRDEAEKIHALIPAFLEAHEELIKLGHKLGAKPA